MLDIGGADDFEAYFVFKAHDADTVLDKHYHWRKINEQGNAPIHILTTALVNGG